MHRLVRRGVVASGIRSIRVYRRFVLQTGCDQFLALREVPKLILLDERLELIGGESVDPAGFGHDEEEDLRSSERRQFVSLLHDTGLSLAEGDVSLGLFLDVLDLNLAPALLLVLFVDHDEGSGSVRGDAAGGRVREGIGGVLSGVI